MAIIGSSVRLLRGQVPKSIPKSIRTDVIVPGHLEKAETLHSFGDLADIPVLQSECKFSEM